MSGYGDDTAMAAWLSDNGLTVPAGPADPTLAVLRQRGSDWLDATYEPQLQCSRRADPDQERAWPRDGRHADLGIPSAWVRASYRAAWLEGTNPGWASGSIDPTRKTRREKVDVIEREFFAPGDVGAGASAGAGNVDAQIAGLVAPLLCAARGVGFMVV